MCLYPKLIKNRKYIPNAKNKGQPPQIKDERVKFVPIGCQNCMECRKQKARGWQVRLLEDIKTNKHGKFITLTFSNESIKQLDKEIQDLEGYDRDNAIATLAMRRFNERWRKKYGKALRHWTVTELGHNGTENIHLHGIIWTNENLTTVQEIWKYGWIWKGKMENGTLKNYVNAKTVNYIIKYVHKQDEQHTTYKSRVLTSPGIGNSYTKCGDHSRNTFNGPATRETYRTATGHKIALPIYWRNKIYTDTERESLWLLRLDKNERWVNGEKVSIKNGEQQYWELLKFHQQKNTDLGYGNDETNWERKRYEKERRMLMQKARINSFSKVATASETLTKTQRNEITIYNTKWYITENGLTTDDR